MPPTPSTTATPGLAGALTAWVGLAAAVAAPAAAASASPPGPGHGPPAAAGRMPAAAPAAAGPLATTPAPPSPARADTTEAPTGADVAFMRGMIHHHAQAVVMARMVPDRAESPALRRLAARILNSQKTEIDLMADWLRDRGEPVPEIAARVEATARDDAADGGATGDAATGGARSDVTPPGGWDAGPQMPGVLSDEKMRRLRAARGEAFDRLFLTWMIDHHQGAVTMVEDLVRSPGAARGEAVFRLASGIRADQETEIDRMRTMLRELVLDGGTP